MGTFKRLEGRKKIVFKHTKIDILAKFQIFKKLLHCKM